MFAFSILLSDFVQAEISVDPNENVPKSYRKAKEQSLLMEMHRKLQFLPVNKHPRQVQFVTEQSIKILKRTKVLVSWIHKINNKLFMPSA